MLMFEKQTYIRRRNELKKLVNDGIILLFGNNESPMNYPANAYYPHRQDSSFIYYFGQHREGLVGVIDIDNIRGNGGLLRVQRLVVVQQGGGLDGGIGIVVLGGEAQLL